MTLPPQPPDASELRINTSRQRRHHARPFQFGLGSVFALTTAAALAVWLGPDNWRLAMYGLAAVCGVLAVVRLTTQLVRKPPH